MSSTSESWINSSTLRLLLPDFILASFNAFSLFSLTTKSDLDLPK